MVRKWMTAVVIVALVASSGVAYGQFDRGGEIFRDERPERPERSEWADLVAADRASVVDHVMSQRYLPDEGEMSSRDKLRAELERVSDDRLLRAADATTLSALRGALVGESATRSESPRGDRPGQGAGTMALGDVDADLVYTPVAPCRIFDTRIDNDGPMTSGEDRSFFVYTPSLIVGQGGDASGCPALTDVIAAVVLNLTAADPVGNGNARAYPFAGTVPGTSNLNYRAGVNIANASITPICYLCGSDIRVKVSNNEAQVIGDVVGYFSRGPSCPGGTFESDGRCFESALRPAASFLGALDTCQTVGRLGSLSELDVAIANGLGGTSNGEWTDSIFRDDGVFSSHTISDVGGISTFDYSTTKAFRCSFDVIV